MAVSFIRTLMKLHLPSWLYFPCDRTHSRISLIGTWPVFSSAQCIHVTPTKYPVETIKFGSWFSRCLNLWCQGRRGITEQFIAQQIKKQNDCVCWLWPFSLFPRLCNGATHLQCRPSFSLIPLWKRHHSHTERCASPIKLIRKTNHHKSNPYQLNISTYHFKAKTLHARSPKGSSYLSHN